VPAQAVQSVSKQEVQSESIEEKPPVVGEKTEQPSNLHKITSPMVGTFYGASSPDEDPYIKIGEKVKKDTIVCIVEAMKLFNEIEAEVSGEIVEVLVEDGQLIEYGQPLFLVKAE
jgi:acetyl-CoA carboxylase biotin carboxyl carrier protein